MVRTEGTVIRRPTSGDVETTGRQIACGITTVHRRADVLPRTIASLIAAGFTVDLVRTDDGVKAFGNWCLTLQELTFRFPESRLYAVFQDDVLLSRGVKELVERKLWEPMTYLSLITYPQVAQFRPSPGYEGWFRSNQRGKGAQALVFDREAVTALLTSRMFFERRFNTEPDSKGRPMGTRNIDGGVSDAMRKLGYEEVCHYPSPVAHVVELPSAIGNSRQPEITSWRGEGYDYSSGQ